MPVGILGMFVAVGRGLASIHDVIVTVAPAEGLQRRSVSSSNVVGVLTLNGLPALQRRRHSAVDLRRGLQ